MNAETEKKQLLEQFQNYLEQSSVETVIAHEQPDLNTLLTEMLELKTEVKTEARQFKKTLDTLSSALETVQQDNKTLSEKLFEAQQQQDEMRRTMLLEFIDIYDRLTAGATLFQNYSPVKSIFKRSRSRDIKVIKQFQQGQNMSLKRFEQLLQSYQVRTIDCRGKSFDPKLMKAVETATDKKVENAVVLEELLTGFLYKDQVLRLAEVKVNKIY